MVISACVLRASSVSSTSKHKESSFPVLSAGEAVTLLRKGKLVNVHKFPQ